MNIGFLIYPGYTFLDVVSASEVLSRLPNTNTMLVWKETETVVTDTGFITLPNISYAECPDLDLICIPGGMGQPEIHKDEETLTFINKQGSKASYVTSVCGGSLLLGEAGLLDGYRATCHWAFIEKLKVYGAIPVNQRVVIDGNRYSGGGVTAGIDFGLKLVADIAGVDYAKYIQLLLEYNPEPPFNAGHPKNVSFEFANKICSDLNEVLPENWKTTWAK